MKNPFDEIYHDLATMICLRSARAKNLSKSFRKVVRRYKRNKLSDRSFVHCAQLTWDKK